MLDRIIYPQPEGPIAVVHPVRVPIQEGETDWDAILRHAKEVVPAGTPFRIVPAAAIPTDRAWRAAWDADFSSPDGVGERA